MKTGDGHLNSLRDGRAVYLLGRRVDDVTTHPAFRNSVASAAALYDFAAAPENIEKMTFVSPATGVRVNRCWQLPTSYEDLVARREALAAWAETHFGFMGRSPDHVASCISGMYMGLGQFEAFDPRSAAALRDYYAFARDRDLFLTYVIINPQADRSKDLAGQTAHPAAHICGRDSDGILVQGAKMLGTSALMANEVFVTTIQPLKPGEEPFAISFVVPMNIPGLKILARKSYELAAGSIFDNPLSSRFDENDAVLYFDQVRVPWERVFIAGDIAMCQKQFHETPAHVYQNYQCQIRLMVKFRFFAGLGRKITAALGTDGLPQVRQTLGQLAADAAMVEGLLHAMEIKGKRWGAYFVPDSHLLYTALTPHAAALSANDHHAARTGGREHDHAPLRRRGSGGPGSGALHAQRAALANPGAARASKFFKLVWDAVGSEFASRHMQYEMFYAGAGFVTSGHSFRTYDWDRAAALADRLLGGYNSAEEIHGHPERAQRVPSFESE